MLWTLENGIYYLVIQFLVWDLVSHMIIWKTVFIPSLILLYHTAVSSTSTYLVLVP
jgi:hypothetical protein